MTPKDYSLNKTYIYRNNCDDADTISVSFASTTGFDQNWVDLLLPQVTDSRQEKVSRLRPLQSKINSLAAELLLLDELRLVGIDNPHFACTDKGKPRLKENSDFHFSLSHSGEAVACILARKAVGIDIEHIRPYKDGVAKRFFHPEEYASLTAVNAQEQAQLFTRYWTCKESFVKLIGDGIGRDFSTFIVRMIDDTTSTIDWDGLRYTCITCSPIEGYILTYAAL